STSSRSEAVLISALAIGSVSRRADTREPRTTASNPITVEHRSKRTDGKIAQPQVGEVALLPDAEQRPVEREPDRVITALDRDADAVRGIVAVDIGPAAQRATCIGIGPVQPARQRD